MRVLEAMRLTGALPGWPGRQGRAATGGQKGHQAMRAAGLRPAKMITVESTPESPEPGRSRPTPGDHEGNSNTQCHPHGATCQMPRVIHL